jgi:hypothetical protein
MGYQGLGGSDAMTDYEPNSVSMEHAMQAIRDALGYRENLEPQRELISNLPRDNDFLIKRLAAVEERKANDAQAERLCQSIPLITDCIKKMWLAGLTQKDITVLFRQVFFRDCRKHQTKSQADPRLRTIKLRSRSPGCRKAIVARADRFGPAPERGHKA